MLFEVANYFETHFFMIISFSQGKLTALKKMICIVNGEKSAAFGVKGLLNALMRF